MRRMRKRVGGQWWAWLAVLALSVVWAHGVRAAVPGGAGAAHGTVPAHWAAPAAESLYAIGVWDDPLPLARLDDPVDPTGWRLLVVRALFPAAVEWQERLGLTEDVIGQYTTALASGDHIERGRAFSGLAKLLGIAGQLELTDVRYPAYPPRPDWGHYDPVHEPLVATVVNEGIISGYPDGRLHLPEPLTFGQAFAVIERVLSRYGSPQVPPAPAPPPGQIGASVRRGSVTLSLNGVPGQARVGEPVRFTAMVQNQGEEPVPFVRHNIGDPPVTVVVEDGRGVRARVDPAGLPEIRLPTLHQDFLASQSSVELHLDWQPPSPGIYQVRAHFYMGELRAGESPSPLLVLVTLEAVAAADGD